ncbi:hypothetical protein Goklo_001162 [Gossypium klotzschianum]|uniref:Uncharacterized protein n=1 Tax=Gossypium klotzschianum TaxID=34286 RepID=A0A7J8VZJ4_9ROSI|nr:hypothetical protein [Gossypium klotzschianum]
MVVYITHLLYHRLLSSFIDFLRRMFPKPHCYDLILHSKIGMNMQTKHKKKKARKHDSELKCRRWKGELEEIRKEQNSIREGQSKVGEKLEAMEIECEALHEESKLMIERSALTHIRFAVMLNILTVRKNGDYAKAAHFTQLLREIIAKDNMQQQQTLRNS